MPQLKEAHHNLGVAYFNLRRYNEAEKHLGAAISLDLNDAVVRLHLGTTYVALGNRSGALEQYKMLQLLDADLARKLYEGMYKGLLVVVPKK